MKKILLVSLLSLLVVCVHAQSVFAPLNADYYHLLDRYEIKQGTFEPGFHTSSKPYTRKSIATMAERLLQDENYQWNDRDKFNLNYLAIDSWEWTDSTEYQSRNPVFKNFYRAKSDLYHVDEPAFDLHVNPVLYLGVGADRGFEGTHYVNTRGVEVRGMIDKKVGFYSFIGENQALFPAYVRGRIRDTNVVPGEGFWKGFGENAVDFFTARGYITFNPTEHIGIQFGHDQNIIGNGARSLILSDYAPSYLFLKTHVEVWRFKYSNLFTQMYADAYATGGGSLARRFPRKHLASHHLSFNISDNFNLGVFETIVFGRTDTAMVGSSFDIAYLNPVIFYRAVEQQGGSQHNSILGADFKWNFLKHFSMYGQWIFDEFRLDQIQAGEGWWANKWSGQIGLKYIDALGIPNLDLQGEFNFSRPYMYAHRFIETNYAHYRQPLAHPLGANFREIMGIMRYQISPRLQFTGKAFMAMYGTDTGEPGSNVGQNILLDYRSRDTEFGNEIGQGVGNDLLFVDLTASYQLRHNLFIDLQQTFRRLDSEVEARSNTTNFTGIALRLNVARREHMF